MKNGTHENYKIRNECYTYGADSFRWEILERCEAECLVEREQWWMDALKPELNILLTADNHNCTETERRKEARKRQAEKITGRKQSQEEKDKRAKSIREFWARPENKGKKIVSKEQRDILREKNSGKNNPNWGKPRNLASKEKARDSLSKIVYVFLSPDGTEFYVRRGLVQCVDEGLPIPYWAARNLYRGMSAEDHGWKFLRVEPKLPLPQST